MPHDKLVEACLQYRVNFLASDTASTLNFAHFVEALPSDTRAQIKIQKIMYTSETMSRSKRGYLRSVFGPVAFFSTLAAGETGPWAVTNLSWASRPDGGDTDADDAGGEAVDFVYDMRSMRVEVLALSVNPLSTPSPKEEDLVPKGIAGNLILTSLQRLRNPLVRYVSGDVGSVHPLPLQVSQ